MLDNIRSDSGPSAGRGWFPIDVNLDGYLRRFYYFVLEDIQEIVAGDRLVRKVQYLLKEEQLPEAEIGLNLISFFVCGQWHEGDDDKPLWRTTPVYYYDQPGTEGYLKHFFLDEEKRSFANNLFSIIFTQIDKQRHPEVYVCNKSKP